mgnify:CR=1 FL=1
MFIDERVRKSMDLYKRAEELIPGKTQLVSRRASQFAEGVSPVYAKNASGSRFTDVDDNEYIDWNNCVSAVILGHTDASVSKAVKDQIDKGSLFTINSPLEIELAELLVEVIPSAEMVRYCKGGGEACAVAVKIARGTTGRDKVLFCGYHGWHDWYQSVNYLADPNTGEFPIIGIEPIGVPKALAGTALPFEYGDLDNLRQLFEQNKGEVAAVIMEPLRSDLPPDGYLERVKEIAHQNGAMLIFDEVSSGWRTRIGGIQEYLNVTPDMSVFAKAISNGFPMGVVVGSRESMELADRMFISSSYWSDNVGLAASLTTINELIRRESVTRFDELGTKLRDSLRQAVNSSGIAAQINGWHYRCTVDFDLPDEDLRQQVNTLFIQEMSRQGIHTLNSFMPTLSHTDEDIHQTAEAAEKSFKVMMQAMEQGIDKFLDANVQREPFKRLVT